MQVLCGCWNLFEKRLCEIQDIWSPQLFWWMYYWVTPTRIIQGRLWYILSYSCCNRDLPSSLLAWVIVARILHPWYIKKLMQIISKVKVSQVLWRVLTTLVRFQKEFFFVYVVMRNTQNIVQNNYKQKRKSVSLCRTPILTSKESASPLDDTVVAVVFLYRTLIVSTILDGIP